MLAQGNRRRGKPGFISRKKIPAEAGILKNAAITYSRLATTIGRTVLTAVFGMGTGVALHVMSPWRYVSGVWQTVKPNAGKFHKKEPMR